jgi:2-polyprenyl-3-methyl-5-hydroxy-6-metoxy-1,4-benzoquinol methylase
MKPVSKSIVIYLLSRPMNADGSAHIAQTSYSSSAPTWPNRYMWPVLLRILEEQPFAERRVFEVGSGNGATAGMLAECGFKVIGIDPSREGIEIAKQSFPSAEFHSGTCYDDLAARYGRFPIVIGLEVIEHCYSPSLFLKTMHDLLEPRGLGIISTPFHGYWKNLALAVTGGWDNHFDPLCEDGHIKFFSEVSLARALRKTGFSEIGFCRAGRASVVAKSMLAYFRR